MIFKCLMNLSSSYYSINFFEMLFEAVLKKWFNKDKVFYHTVQIFFFHSLKINQYNENLKTFYIIQALEN